MQHADDPPRLLDDPEAAGDLRLGLERFSRDLPGPERLARLAAALGVDPTLPANPAPSPGKSLAGKLALGGGAVGIAAVALFLAMQKPGADTAKARPPAELTAPQAGENAPLVAASPNAAAGSSERKGAATPGAENAPSTPTAEPSVDANAANAPRVETPPSERAANPVSKDGTTTLPSTPSGSVASGSSPSTKSTASAPRASSSLGSPTAAPPPSETELLRDARLVLERDPNQALALSEQHRRAYPNGGFSQERELIAITALVKLGRSAEARSRAERFRHNYPRSAYGERLNRLVPQ